MSYPPIEELGERVNALWTDSSSLTEELVTKLGVGVSMATMRAFNREDRTRPPGTLYVSELGKPCIRQIWYGYHHPTEAELLPASARTKFLYGDILENYVLTMVKAAGYRVTHEQEPVQIRWDGFTIKGRMDAVINDTNVVDVKSCSSFAYKKFQEGLNDSNDSFGYRFQVSAYELLPSGRTPFDGRGFIAIDKQNGHVGYFPMDFYPISTKIETVTAALKNATPPDRHFTDQPEGKSGNRRLCVECSYCPYKHACWSDANGGRGLQGYVYSYGPVWLTEVKRAPSVPSIATPEYPPA